MKQYHKIQTVYFRNPDDKFKTLIEGNWAKDEFAILQDINWICTEKIDGTNIRIIWDGFNVRFKGKTDNAQIPTSLVAVLQDTFTSNIMNEIFIDRKLNTTICLYGEGYGTRIQKGSNYLRDSVNFILFDIKIGNWWLTREANEHIAKKLNIDIVPIIKVCNLKEAINIVKSGYISTISDNKQYIAEGLVMKPEIELFNRKGERIITKIKYKDFKR